MKYEVTVKKWGTYKKGDVLEMHPTTGDACKLYVKPLKEGKNKK